METRTGIHVRNGVRQGSVPPVPTGYHLNSSRIVVDEDGTPVEGIAYHAYGKTDILLEAPSSGGENSVREKFTGKEHDLDGADDGLGVKGIALDYFGFRYYDAEVGVWTCADPAMEFYHGYSYVGGEPVTTVDPLGLQSYGHVSTSGGCGWVYVNSGSGGNNGSSIMPNISPLEPDALHFGGVLSGSNYGGSMGSYAPGTPYAGSSGFSGDGGSLTEHDYVSEAMSGEGGGDKGVSSEDIEKNKARAKEKSGEYTKPGADRRPASEGRPAAYNALGGGKFSQGPLAWLVTRPLALAAMMHDDPFFNRYVRANAFVAEVGIGHAVSIAPEVGGGAAVVAKRGGTGLKRMLSKNVLSLGKTRQGGRVVTLFGKLKYVGKHAALKGEKFHTRQLMWGKKALLKW